MMTNIEWFVNELGQKNIVNNYIISKAKKLPMCRKNIVLTIISCWDKHITNICYDIISDRPTSIIDITFRCKEFVNEYKLASPNFIEFFFNIFEPISTLYKNKIEEVINSDLNKHSKISSILYLYGEFINLTWIFADCFEIDCIVLGNNAICNNHICKKQPNIITLMITEEFISNQDVLDKIIDGLSYIKNKDDVLLIVDYRNLCSYVENYSWEESNAYCRYKKCINYVHDIYFYKCGCVDFGKYYDELKNKILKTKVEYEKLKQKWLEKRQKNHN